MVFRIPVIIILSALVLLFPVASSAEPYVDLVRYEYDGLNRLKSASTGAGISQSFTHDDVSNRVDEERRDSPIGAPRARSDAYVLDENTSLSVPVTGGVLDNDSTNTVANPVSVAIVEPLFGTFNLNEDGSFTYQPNTDFYGDDEFAYQIQSDTFSSNIVRVQLSVLPENPLPIANDDIVEVIEDQSILISVLANDSNVTSISAVGKPFHGTTVISGVSITYTPAIDYVGQDVFTYQAQGPEGISTARVMVTVAAENDPPVLNDIEHWMNFGGSASIPVLASARDPEEGELTLTSATGASNGTVALDNGMVVYTPTNFDPLSDGDNAPTIMTELITYSVEDEVGATSQATIIMRVSNDTDSPPKTIDDCYDKAPPIGGDFKCNVSNTDYEIEFETPTLLSVLANDYDPSGEQLSITNVQMDSAFGTVSVQGDQVLLTPAVGVQEQIIYFFYSIENSSGVAADDDGVVIALVKSKDNSDDLPVARDDCYNASASTGCTQSDNYLIDFNSSKVLDVLSNDSDPNGELLQIVVNNQGGLSQPENGSTSLTSDNKIRYTPNGNADTDGFQDSFIYQVRNESGLVAEATVYVYVKPRDNKAPIARSDSFIVFVDKPKELTLTANDSDPNFDDLSIVENSIVQPNHGVVERISASTVRYTPPNNFEGQTIFRYKVTDGSLESAEVSVTVNVKEMPPLVPVIMMLLDEVESSARQE